MAKKDFTQLPSHIQERFEEMGVDTMENLSVKVQGMIDKVFSIGTIDVNTDNKRYTIIENHKVIASLKNFFLEGDEAIKGEIKETREGLSPQQIDLFLANYPQYQKYRDDKDIKYKFTEINDETGNYIQIARMANDLDQWQSGLSFTGRNIYPDGTQKYFNYH